MHNSINIIKIKNRRKDDMKMMNKVALISTLGIAALIINVNGGDKPFVAPYDFNIENNSEDKILQITITSQNPKWKPLNYIEARTFDRSGRLMPAECELRGDGATIETFIILNPGENYLMKGVNIALPAYYQMYAYTEDYDFSWHVGGGSLPRKEDRHFTAPKSLEYFQGASIIYNLKYNDSTSQGSFGITLEQENLEEL